MKRLLAASLLALGCCGPTLATAAAAAFTLETAAPRGFADLTAPETLVADVYYGNRVLGSTRVTVDPQFVQFEELEQIFALLPPTLNPALVRARLASPLPRNSGKVCFTRQQRDCGILEPDDLGLIYDDSRFRIDLFFAPSLLPTRAALDTPFLPDASNREAAFIQNLTGSWSGVRTDYGPNSESAALFGQSILSFGESGVHSQWATTDTGDHQVYELHWTRDYQGKAYSAGLIQPGVNISSLTTTPHLYGLQWRSSNNSRADTRHQQGALLEVNMPVRGRVELRKDNRLIHSELLEAGNQLIDTSSLPGGAYPVEVRTYDESGNLLSQYGQFFAKDSLLPAPGEWRWSLQAGAPARVENNSPLPERVDAYLFQGDLARRVTDNTGVFAGLAMTGQQQVLEAGGRWIGQFFEISPSALAASDGRNGYRLRMLLKTPRVTLSVSEAQLDQEPRETGDEYTLLATGYLQRNAALSSEFLGGQLALRYSERDQPQEFTSPTFELDSEIAGANHLTTVEYRRNLFRNRHWLGDLTLSHSNSDGEHLTSATFQFRFRTGRWNHSASLRTDDGRADDQNTRLGFLSNWNDRDLWALEVDQQFQGETSADEYYLGSYTRVAGRRGHLTSTLNYRNGTSQSALNYLGSFSTSLISNGDSAAWGGERSLNSAVVVEIEGSEDQEFEILVDGNRRGYARGNERSVVSLPAFKSYDISLKPLSQGFHDYRDQQQTVTLYPGNVADTRYSIQPVILVIGRLMHAGKPVGERKISIGSAYTVTDEYGVFQLELHGDPRTLEVPPVQWKGCQVPIPEQVPGEHWINIGVVDLDTARCPMQEEQHDRR